MKLYEQIVNGQARGAPGSITISVVVEFYLLLGVCSSYMN